MIKIKTTRPISARIADIGAGRREYNIRTIDMKTQFNPGDKVAFSQAVIRRTNDGTRARGTVVSAGADVVAVDFAGTWIAHENGGTVRHVPTANLTKIQPNGVILSD